MKTNVFRHFGQYFIINFRFYATYHFSIGAGLGLFVAGYSFLLTYFQPLLVKNFLDVSFWFLLNICGIILTTSAFSVFGKKSTALPLLTIPVSSLTRYITAWLYAIPLFFITIIITYTLVAKGIAWGISNMGMVKEFTFNPFKMDANAGCSKTWGHFQTFLIIQSITLLAGAFFTKLGFIKTMGLFVALILAYTFINSLLFKNSADHDFAYNLISILTTDSYQNKEILKQMPITSLIWRIVLMLVIPVTMYIGYLRIKEIEA